MPLSKRIFRWPHLRLLDFHIPSFNLTRLPKPPTTKSRRPHHHQPNTRRVIFLITLAFLITIGPLTYLYYRQHRQAEAAWWSDSWRYRKLVQISNGSGSTLTDFQTKIVIDTSDTSKFNATCGDIRFVSSDNKELPYWIDSGCGTSTTIVWVKIPVIPASGSQIHIYYGNPNATTTQSGKDTFIYFDDFQDGSINVNLWKLANGSNEISETANGLTLAGGTAGSWDQGIYLAPPIPRSDVAMEFNYKQTSNNSTSDALMMGWKDDTPDVSYSNLVYAYYNASADTCTSCWNYVYEDGNSRGVVSDNWLNNTLYRIRIRMRSSGGAYYSMSTNGGASWTNSLTSSYSTESNLHPGWMLLSGTHIITNFFVRKDASSDPTASFGSEEFTAAPLAYWKFDQGATNTAQDSINNYDGTLSGTTAPTWQQEDACISGKCLYYDGSSSYTSLPSSLSDPNTFGGTTGSWSLSMWIRPNDLGTNYRTVFRRLSGMHYLAFNPSSKQLQVMVWDGVGSQNAWYTSSSAINPNVWTHITVELKGGEGFKFYINGKLDSNNPNTNLRLYNYGSDTAIAGDLGGYQYYQGYIDEVAIYPYQLTDSQVYSIYKAGKAHQPAFKTTAANLGGNKFSQDSLSDALVGYWKMDESSWNGTTGEVKDTSGNNNNATSVSGATTTSGKFGNSGSFNGSNSYAVTGSFTYPASSGKSGCAWVKPTAHTNSLAAVFRNGNGGPSLRLDTSGYFNDRVVNYAGTTSSAYSSTSPVPTGSWSHVCVVWESPGANQYIKLRYYINGNLNLDQTTDLTDPNGYVGANNTYAYRFGSDPDISSRIFNGLIDEVRLYNRALSNKEVQQLYNWAPGPIAHWKMDENTGTNTYDSSGNNRTGSLVNGALWGPAKYGSGASLDGDNDAVYFDNSIPLASYKLPMTIEGWIYTGQQTESSPGIISLDKWPYGYAGLSLQIGAKSGSAYQLYVHYGDGSYVYPSTPGTAQRNSKNTGYVLHENTWQHITAVINGYNNINIYINGVEVSGTYSGTAATMGWCSTMCDDTLSVLGMNWHSGSSNFKGMLDDFRVYNYARTPSQIIEDMYAGKPVTSPTSQLTYLKLDEGYGTSGKDGGSLSNHSILRNSPTWTNNGRFDKAVSLDGNNDYVELPYHSAYEYTGGDMGFSLWIYRDSAETDVARIVSKPWNGGGGYNYILLIDTNGTLQFGVGGATWWGMSTTQAIPVNTWSHVAATVKGATKKVSLYINGNLVQSGTHDITSWVHSAGNATLPLVLGTLYPYGDGWGGITSFSFKGIIDEFKFSTTELNQEDVKNDFNRGSAILIGTTSTTSTGAPDSSASRSYCVPGDTSSCSPPVVHYTFDEGQGSSLNDASSNNITGSWNGNGSYWTSGKFGSAGQFNGSSNYVSTVTSGSPLPSTGDFTLQAWIYRNDAGNTQIISKTGSGGTGGYALLLGDWGEAYCRTDNGSTWVDSVTGYNLVTPTSGWTHVTAVKSGTSCKIFINGSETTISQFGSHSSASNTLNLTIGRRADVNTATEPFNGFLDDIRIYNYARTSAQIAWDYNRGTPVAHYRLDECEGNTIHSSTEPYLSTLNGTISIGSGGTQNALGNCIAGSASQAWYNGVNGKLGSSLNFDGSDDNIAIPITSTNGLNATGPVSFAAWFKRANTGTYQTIVSDISSCSNPLDGFIIRFTEGNTIMFQGYKGDPTNSNVFNAVYTDSTLWSDTTNWHHVVGTWDGTTNSNGAKIYIDGNLVGQGTSTAASFNSLSGINQMIGSLNCNAHYFAGKIDDVRIYNYALTAYQIKQVYNNGASAIFGSPSNNR